MLLTYTVTIEAYLGDSAYGPQYAPPVTARAYVEEKAKTIRKPGGEEVVASTTMWLLPDQACPVESRVTLTTRSGTRTASVIASDLFDGGGLPTPDHRAVMLS